MRQKLQVLNNYAVEIKINVFDEVVFVSGQINRYWDKTTL